MVIPSRNFRLLKKSKQFDRNANSSRRASLMIEIMVAIALLMGALLPLAYSFASERRYARTSYQQAVAMEIVDGEIEVLAAGEWQTFPPGTHDYHVTAEAATNLPAGRFLLTVADKKVRLEWQPEAHKHGGSAIVREVIVQ